MHSTVVVTIALLLLQEARFLTALSFIFQLALCQFLHLASAREPFSGFSGEGLDNRKRSLKEGKGWKLVVEMVRIFPLFARLRSSDGRGPLWWAYEADNARLVKVS